MTTHDELIEKVARALCRHILSFENMVPLEKVDPLAVDLYWNSPQNLAVASAAIAEYEAHTERAAISLADKYQDKLAKLEAQCAVMRAALDVNNIWLEAALTCEGWRWDPDQQEAAQDSLEKGKAALSPIAPAKPEGARICRECGVYPADLPGEICTGCAAYKEHTAVP